MICRLKWCKADDFITPERLRMLDHVVLTIYNLVSHSMHHGRVH